jgi:hypothetical protein
MLNFFKRNLEASQKGTETQQIDMEGLVAVAAKCSGELSDFMGGRRKLDAHKHHHPKDLADVILDGIEAIHKLRREIER